MTHKQSKSIIRQALREASDEKLITLLDDARAGKVPYEDCDKCFCGHLFESGWVNRIGVDGSSVRARYLAAIAASTAYLVVGGYRNIGNARLRQRILVPMILAEVRRRTRAMQPVEAEAAYLENVWP